MTAPTDGRVVAYEFTQGERIYLGPIAEELGVSTTPVRDALNRLVAEDLVIKESKKGFIALTLTEDNLKGHYELTRELLCRELEQIKPPERRRLSECETIAGVLTKLNRRKHPDCKALATYTGELFAHLVAIGENPLAVHSIKRSNDHLYYIRTVECQILETVQSDLTCMCELLLAGECEALIEAINAYHDKRLSLMRTLIDFARR